MIKQRLVEAKYENMFLEYSNHYIFQYSNYSKYSNHYTIKTDPTIQLVLVFGSCNIVRAVINFYEVNITTIVTANLNPK